MRFRLGTRGRTRDGVQVRGCRGTPVDGPVEGWIKVRLTWPVVMAPDLHVIQPLPPPLRAHKEQRQGRGHLQAEKVKVLVILGGSTSEPE